MMEKVDQLIEDLAEHISNILKREDKYQREHDIAEKSAALAALIAARDTEERATLQSTDKTLKRIEKVLLSIESKQGNYRKKSFVRFTALCGHMGTDTATIS